MLHDPDPNDLILSPDELSWKLSQIRLNVPEVHHTMPDRCDAESLLMLQLVETEFIRDEWRRIAESNREALEQAIEIMALLQRDLVKQRGLNVTLASRIPSR